jgi:hypothetical protein
MPAWAACTWSVRSATVRVPVTWLITIGTSAALTSMPTRVISMASGIEPWSERAGVRRGVVVMAWVVPRCTGGWPG